MATTHTIALTPAQAEALRLRLADSGFAPREVEHAMFSAARPGVNVTVYAKGPKVVVQGREADDFVSFILEPEILGEARLGYEEHADPEMFSPHFGVDESGKGDFFGPLVVAGVFTDAAVARSLLDAGVADSKAIGSDKRIRELAGVIRATPGAVSDVLVLAPETYNRLYAKIGNLNRLLAWGHARVIENLCERRPDCPRALSDQFARHTGVLRSALMERGRGLELQQRTKGESDIAVAAASILAREGFVEWMDRAGREAGMKLPKGGGPAATNAAADLVRSHGADALPRFVKTHFRNASRLTV